MGKGEALSRERALQLIRPTDRPAFVEACDFMGCAETSAEEGEGSDEVIRLLDDGHGGRGIYVSCGEYPGEGSMHFGLDPAGRAMRGNARHRRLMLLISLRTKQLPPLTYWRELYQECGFVPCVGFEGEGCSGADCRACGGKGEYR